MDNTLDLISKLKEELPSLNKAMRKVAQMVLDDFNFVLKASNAQMAEKADVSEATIVRFCRQIGCDGLPDFKLKMAQSIAVGERYLIPSNRDYSDQDVSQRVLHGALEALTLVGQQLDTEAVNQAANALVNADKVLVAGSGGGSTINAQDLQFRLFRMNINIVNYPDSLLQGMVAATLKERDVLILFSASGLNREMIALVEQAKSYNTHTIAITRSGSKLAGLVDTALEIDIPEHDDIFRPTASRYAMMGVGDILSTAVGYMKGDEVTDDLRRIKFFLVNNREEDGSNPLGD